MEALRKVVPEEKIDSLLQILKKPPRCTTLRLNLLKNEKDAIMKELKRQLDDQCKRKGWPEFQILQDQEIEEMVCIPAIITDQVIVEGKEVVVDVECGQAVLRGANVFIPGVISMENLVRKNEKVAVYADIYGKCKKGSIMKFDGPRIFLGTGISQVDRSEIFQLSARKNGVAIEMQHVKYSHPSFAGCMEDTVFLQNLPSILTGKILSPKPGMKVLDMCSSPGGKTTHLAQIMGNSGIVIALDKNNRKAELVSKNAKRFGLENVRAFCLDASSCINEDTGLFSLQDLQCSDVQKYGLKSESFDRILLDPPCSGLGQRPFLSDNFNVDGSFDSFQIKLFRCAVKLLRPGGEMTYSTCTLNPIENEAVLSKILQQHSNLELLNIESIHGHEGLLGYTNVDPKKVKRFVPSEDCDTVAFFIAHLRKINNTTS